jgi:hypothetical protein
VSAAIAGCQRIAVPLFMMILNPREGQHGAAFSRYDGGTAENSSDNGPVPVVKLAPSAGRQGSNDCVFEPAQL